MIIIVDWRVNKERIKRVKLRTVEKEGSCTVVETSVTDEVEKDSVLWLVEVRNPSSREGLWYGNIVIETNQKDTVVSDLKTDDIGFTVENRIKFTSMTLVEVVNTGFWKSPVTVKIPPMLIDEWPLGFVGS